MVHGEANLGGRLGESRIARIRRGLLFIGGVFSAPWAVIMHAFSGITPTRRMTCELKSGGKTHRAPVALFRDKLPQRLAKRFLYSTSLGGRVFRAIKPLIIRQTVVMLAVTYRCTCRCEHCGVKGARDHARGEMDTGEMLNLIDQLARSRAKVGTLYLFGGEPLVRRDLLTLIHRAKEHGLKVVIDTNGALLDEAMADRLAAAGVERVRVSIDSAIPEHHDANRRLPGLYAKAIAGACLMRDRGVRTELSTFCTPEKIESGEVADVKRVARENRLNGVRILSTICSGGFVDSQPLAGDCERKLYSLLEPGFAYYEMPNIDHPKYRFQCYSALRGYFFISPYGDVQPCCFMPVTFGNLRDEPLDDIVDRMWRHQLFDCGSSSCLMNRAETHAWIASLPTEGDPRQGPIDNRMQA